MYNEAQPSLYPPRGRVIVIGDVHGDVQHFMRCLYAAKVFDQNLQWIAEPRDTMVIQLGDQIDSLSRGGTPNWENVSDVEMLFLTDKLDRIARLHGGRVISLIGNHELMNTLGDFTYVSPTSIEKVSLDIRRRMFQPKGTLANILANRNILVQVGSHIFCHGGLLPHHLDACKDQHQRLNDVMRKYLTGHLTDSEDASLFQSVIASDMGVLWTRLYIDMMQNNMPLLIDVMRNVHNRMRSRYIFVGHNTVPGVLLVEQANIYFVDTGISRAYPTPKLQFVEILNMDTPQETIRAIEVKTTP